MKPTTFRCFVLYTALLYGVASLGNASEEIDQSGRSADISIKMQSGLVSVEARDAPLDKIMRSIGEQAGFSIFLAKNFVEPPLISLSLQDVTVVEAVQRLVREENRIVIYRSEGEDGNETRVISEVWLLGVSNATNTFEVSEEEAITGADKETVNSHKLVKLIRMLQPDQEVSMRARAAIALGASGDEQAVMALESALLDTELAVRLQAIKGLGRIGGERATTLVGNILLLQNTEQIERVVAAQVLWKQDSDLARNYLSAGIYEEDDQVRRAATKPPSSLAGLPAKRSQINGVASQ